MTVRRIPAAAAGLMTAILVFGSAEVAGAQIRVLDEGTFEIRISGTPVGTETFSIRRSGPDANPQIVATAEITISGPDGELHLRPALQVIGQDMRVSAYQQKISGVRAEDINLTAEGDRFFTRSRTDAGEREREFRAGPGTLVLDSQVAHHHFFLATLPDGSVSLVVPAEGRQDSLPLSTLEGETLQVGDVSVSTRRVRLGSGESAHTIWFDSEGRVMRVESPALGYVAVRLQPPVQPR